MTSKISFFNKGVYKSTVKRYMWGSVLYFILLFIINGLSIIMSYDRWARYAERNQLDGFVNNPLVLRGDYLGISTAITAFVPTVAALLIFRFLHSKKTSVFTHSIPVKRSENYFSSIMAGFTLMFLPVIANGIILMIMSLSGFGEFFTVSSCFTWMGVLLFSIFILFSCAVFSSVIVGNSFAMVVVNALVHCFLLIIAAGLTNLASLFLYGYPGENTVIDSLVSNNFFVTAFSLGNSLNFRNGFTFFKVIEFTAVSIALYFISLMLYKWRKLENVEDIAGFRCLNHIFKYTVTFMATICIFAIMSFNIFDAPIPFIVTVTLISAVAYFASEMLLKKTFNVFAKSYKGYIGFAACFLICVGVFSLTSFFGYETRVPKIEDVDKVSVFNYYYRDSEPITDKEEIKEFIINKHAETVSDGNSPAIPEDTVYDTRLHIKYHLKNGREIYRIYPVSKEVKNEVMSFLYEDDDYKKQCEGVFVATDKIKEISIHKHHKKDETENTWEVKTNNIIKIDAEDFMTELQKDVLELDYIKLRGDEEDYLFNIGFEYEIETDDTQYEMSTRHSWISANITQYHTNTLNWLKENRYIE